MGGEFGPSVTVPAVLDFLRTKPCATALVFGDDSKVRHYLEASSGSEVFSRVKCVHSDLSITDEEGPSSVLRKKQLSSMGLAVKAVSEQRADACISAGSTGALMALGLSNLKSLPGISRPAICTTFPTINGRSYVLDLGANIQCTADQLYQFALMASLTAKLMDGIVSPSVRLLNVGIEDTKGTSEVKRAAQLLEADHGINYCGFIEGDGIFQGIADIVVCDGFSGNIALKTTEGFAGMIANLLESLVTKNFLAKIALGLFSKSFTNLKTRLDPSLYNGAYLLGLNGIVVKSHGSASERAFGHALEVAYDAAQQNLPSALDPLLADQLMSELEERK
jgi:glycerol-3-phosphate acyltransferase PlsX